MTSDDGLCPLTHSLALSQEESQQILVVLQLQEKCITANKQIYMAFLDLEKEFDCVPRKVSWWALRKLCYPGNGCQCAKPCPCCLWLQPKV